MQRKYQMFDVIPVRINDFQRKSESNDDKERIKWDVIFKRIVHLLLDKFNGFVIDFCFFRHATSDCGLAQERFSAQVKVRTHEKECSRHYEIHLRWQGVAFSASLQVFKR